MLNVTLSAILGVSMLSAQSSDLSVSRGRDTLNNAAGIILLPQPRIRSSVSVEEALLARRSVREYARTPLELSDIAQLLWAAQGITNTSEGLRTAPSAGALYPVELYVAVGNVSDVATGVYKYHPQKHGLSKVGDKDIRGELSRAALGQDAVRTAAAVLVIGAVYRRTERKYGARSARYVQMEVGHVAENVYLQAVSLNLGTVVVGSFRDDEVKKIVNMNDEETPLCLMPVGKK